jgi:hypothetical protein
MPEIRCAGMVNFEHLAMVDYLALSALPVRRFAKGFASGIKTQSSSLPSSALKMLIHSSSADPRQTDLPARRYQHAALP